LYVITFYSFKGGVGRTMALVNVAAQLAKMGRKVLLVDFDLEAPGLETFDRLRPAPVRPPKIEKYKDPSGATFLEVREKYHAPTHPGLVEYVTEYLRTNRVPEVRDYIYSVGTVGKKGGQIWVMPAGRRDAEYQSALAQIDWLKLYREQEGFLLFEDTKAQWEQEYQPDYVLIDSRTGHTDVEGICTRQLPDAVVVLFFPNEQNLVGLQEVCERIRNEEMSGLMKRIRLHFVMSNVPDLDDEDRVLRRRLKMFDEELDIDGLDAVIHRYESVMLFNQAIFVLDRPKSRLAHEYKSLMRKLIAHNPADRDGALLFVIWYCRHLKQYLKEMAVGDLKLHPASAGLELISSVDYGLPGSSGDALDQIAGKFPGDAEIQKQVTRCRQARDEFRERCKQVLSEASRQSR
jgi:MinD-like ATPase involved in chromosome partitioning or flagellar assembly